MWSFPEDVDKLSCLQTGISVYLCLSNCYIIYWGFICIYYIPLTNLPVPLPLYLPLFCCPRSPFHIIILCIRISDVSVFFPLFLLMSIFLTACASAFWMVSCFLDKDKIRLTHPSDTKKKKKFTLLSLSHLSLQKFHDSLLMFSLSHFALKPPLR